MHLCPDHHKLHKKQEVQQDLFDADSRHTEEGAIQHGPQWQQQCQHAFQGRHNPSLIICIEHIGNITGERQ